MRSCSDIEFPIFFYHVTSGPTASSRNLHNTLDEARIAITGAASVSSKALDFHSISRRFQLTSVKGRRLKFWTGCIGIETNLQVC